MPVKVFGSPRTGRVTGRASEPSICAAENDLTASMARSMRAINSANVVSLSSHFGGSLPESARRCRGRSRWRVNLARERQHVGIEPGGEEHRLVDLFRGRVGGAFGQYCFQVGEPRANTGTDAWYIEIVIIVSL